MSSSVIIYDGEVETLLAQLKAFGETGLSRPLDKASKALSDSLVSNVLNSRGINGDNYPLINDSTFEMDISWSGPFSDSRTRRQVSSNPRAMNATGKSAESISAQKVSDTEYNVGFDTYRSDLVFNSNARAPGNVSKPKRDPLGLTERAPSDKEFELVAKQVEDALERLLSGF